MTPMRITNEVQGYYKLVIGNAETGEEREVTPWFSNLITNAGLNRLGTGAIAAFCLVGSGSAAPAVTDTALQTFVASAGQAAITNGAQASAPYYGWSRRRYRFDAGVATGNLSEVGIGWASTNDSLFSRERIRDLAGDPTTITVLANEYLDVYYELRLYPPTDDVTYTASICGATRTCVRRAAQVNNAAYWGNNIGGAAVGWGGLQPNVYDGALGTVLQFPSGTAAALTQQVNNAYSNNSLEWTGYAIADFNTANFAGGIDSTALLSNFGAYQISFDPPIEKDNVHTMRLDYAITWSRKTI